MSRARTASLEADACVASNSCFAVGYSSTSAGDVTLIEAWNGSTWTVDATPNPDGATSSVLNEVSCTSAKACTAVGDYTNSSGVTLTLAERWDGTAWTIQTSIDAAGATNSQLRGVSCTSAQYCMATGFSYDEAGAYATLAESWDGVEWKVRTTPNPAGSSSSNFYGVSCSSSSACTAVGAYEDSSSFAETLAEAWNGASWQIQATPNPVDADSSQLFGVSCTSSAACTAVYAGQGSSGNTALVEAWNGASWTIQSIPTPANAQSSELDAVSCTSTSACSAVGDYINGSSTDVPLAEAWNGKAWKISTTPTPSGAQAASLVGVSCTSASACRAVGTYVNASTRGVTLAEAFNGAWTVQTTPNQTGAAYGALDAVSCTSAHACMAVGAYAATYGSDLTLAETFNGSAGTVQVVPNPVGAQSSELKGVSCTSASACTAVGDYAGSSGEKVTLAERWNGTAWSIKATPVPTDSATSGLDGVSCTSATACTAVGAYTNSSGTSLTLADSWNGTSWKVQSSPAPGDQSALAGVSCTSAGACTAVGEEVLSDTALTLAERWNGSTWSVQATPTPAKEDAVILGVSCTTSAACTGAGYAITSSGTYKTLVEAWNGTGWKEQASPDPRSSFSQLASVSCTSASACRAAGSTNGSSGLTEVWNGTTWTAEVTPDLPSSEFSELNGVSCTSASACTTVGDYFDIDLGLRVPVAEVHS